MRKTATLPCLVLISISTSRNEFSSRCDDDDDDGGSDVNGGFKAQNMVWILHDKENDNEICIIFT